jgi:hypothetical protein
MARYVLLVLTLGILSACDAVTGAYDTMKESIVQAQAVSDDIEKAVGARAAVSVNWKNGELAQVSLSFEGVPKDVRVSEIAEHARASLLKRMAKEPKQLLIAFSIEAK